MGSTSFYSQNAVVYTDTNPPGPADAPLPPTSVVAPTSFYKSSASVLTSMMEGSFSLALSIGGATLNANEWLFGYTFDFAGTFAASLAGSEAQAGQGATGTPVLSLNKNGVQFGTLTFSGKVGAFNGPQTSFAIGDLLEVIAPSSPDATLAHIAITLYGTRN